MRQGEDQLKDKAAQVQRLIGIWSSGDGAQRKHAREQLLAIGGEAVPALIAALHDNHEMVRWEAAKTLGDLPDRRAIQPLIAALEDEDEDIRWLAGEALVAMRTEAIVPLLERLMERVESPSLRGGAHHVLKSIRDESLAPLTKPVTDALDTSEPEVAVPLAAEAAIIALRDHQVAGGRG